jgi:predicted nucleic acid-binding Zn ribbon protein
MTRYQDDEEDWDDDGPDGEEEDTTAPCPHCGAWVYDDAVRCPECGKYLSREDAPRRRKPWWVIIGVVVCLYVMLRWIWE